MAQGGAVIIAHDALRERMAKGQYLAAFNQTIPPSPPGALPTVTYADAMTIHFDGETVELVHVPGAHTDNDTLVRFKRANVIHASGTIGGNGGLSVLRHVVGRFARWNDRRRGEDALAGR
jgi:glyoxylase-like metal-dependent hydrolase (beta-lactamase superfamily II)